MCTGKNNFTPTTSLVTLAPMGLPYTSFSAGSHIVQSVMSEKLPNVLKMMELFSYVLVTKLEEKKNMK